MAVSGQIKKEKCNISTCRNMKEELFEQQSDYIEVMLVLLK